MILLNGDGLSFSRSENDSESAFVTVLREEKKKKRERERKRKNNSWIRYPKYEWLSDLFRTLSRINVFVCILFDMALPKMGRERDEGVSAATAQNRRDYETTRRVSWWSGNSTVLNCPEKGIFSASRPCQRHVERNGIVRRYNYYNNRTCVTISAYDLEFRFDKSWEKKTKDDLASFHFQQEITIIIFLRLRSVTRFRHSFDSILRR